jgi:hypothetical protein
MVTSAGGDPELERTTPFPPPPKDQAARFQFDDRWRPREEIVFLRNGIRGHRPTSDGRMNKPGSLFDGPVNRPRTLSLPANHFDERLRDGDWAKIQDFGEGPPEPDWVHSDVRRILPPRDEPATYAVHIEPMMLTGAVSGTMVTIHGGGGESFARFRERGRYRERGGWHLPDAWVTGFAKDRKWSDAEPPELRYELPCWY